MLRCFSECLFPVNLALFTLVRLRRHAVTSAHEKSSKQYVDLWTWNYGGEDKAGNLLRLATPSSRTDGVRLKTTENLNLIKKKLSETKGQVHLCNEYWIS